MVVYVDRHYDLAMCERGLFRWMVILDKEEREKLNQIFLEYYQKYITIEEIYWKKRPIFFLVGIMDNLMTLPDYEKRLSREKTEANLLEELEELILTY